MEDWSIPIITTNLSILTTDPIILTNLKDSMSNQATIQKAFNSYSSFNQDYLTWSVIGDYFEPSNLA